MHATPPDLTLAADRGDPSGPRPAPLKLAGVSRAYRGRPVLLGVDLELTPGTTAALEGVNGAGKTTVLRIAAGLLAPDEGEVRVAGLDPMRDRRAYQQRVGFLPAGNSGLYPRLTTIQMLRMWAGLALIPGARQPEVLAATRTRFGLDDLWTSRVDRLSLGQRQRVRLALTFMHEPEVILLDEPHTSLDDSGIELLIQALDDLRARGGAALWCAPRADRVGIVAEHAYLLEDGKVRPE